MSDLAPFLVASQLSTVAAIATASQVVQLIQQLVDSSWQFSYSEDGWTITGSPNDFTVAFRQEFNYSTELIPGVPSMYGVPAVPALTGGYSSDVVVTVTVKGVNDAITPLLQSMTFSGVSDPTGDPPTQTCMYNLNSAIDGGQLEVSGSAAVDNIVVTIGGDGTDLGSINTGTISLSPVPDIPVEFNVDFYVPSYNEPPPEFPATSTTLAYTPGPSTSGVSIDDLAISSSIIPLADFINNSLLAPLTDAWNTVVCPLFKAVSAPCPTAPTEGLSNDVSAGAASMKEQVDNEAQTELNALLEKNLNTIQTYSQPIVTTGWNLAVYKASGPVVS